LDAVDFWEWFRDGQQPVTGMQHASAHFCSCLERNAYTVRHYHHSAPEETKIKTLRAKCSSGHAPDSGCTLRSGFFWCLESIASTASATGPVGKAVLPASMGFVARQILCWAQSMVIVATEAGEACSEGRRIVVTGCVRGE